ncbi:Fungal specific transcription factor domain-containing protein [Cladophialophora immunda]|nr:Fungal specific transcription factor domain-containing protein [Cladophialophora immunda]
MRTKCSGGNRCTKCLKDNALCVYGDRKRERNKKVLAESLDRIGSLESENSELLTALRAITERPDFQPKEHIDIVDILAKYSKQEEHDPGHDSSSQSQTKTTPSTTPQTSTAHGPARASETTGENRARSSVGSPGKQGELLRIVSLDNGGGASGFVGKMSEISWIQRAFETVRGYRIDNLGDIYAAEMDQNIATTTDFIYFTDDTNILAINEDYVDQFHWPAKDTVVLLSEAFFHAMQGAYHFVLREQFLQQAYQFSAQEKPFPWSQRHWLALANLVWAIGSKWLQLTKLHEPQSDDNHLIYYARARALGLDHRVMFDHPDIERVQDIGLLSFYLLINGSISRAWNTLGHATRHATALGLHLRVTDTNVSELERARRARTWYSLYSLEILIAEITGRPKSIFLTDVTIPIDLFWSVPRETLAFSEQVDHFLSPAGSRKIWLEYLHSGSGISHMTGGMVPWKSLSSVGRDVPISYLPQRLYLCRLSDKVASHLYSGTSEDSWSEIQQKLGNLQDELRQWAGNLPQELAIQGQESAGTDPRAKIELGIYYYSVEMILNRVCLCEITIPDESAGSQEFNRSSARTCVHAAMSMLAMLPDHPTAHEAYQLLPWWELLHFVAQATAVLLLELALDAQHFRNEAAQIVTSLRKAMGYLWCMTEMSLSAYRAWRIFRQLLTEVMGRHDDLDLTDIPTEAAPPPGWNDALEAVTTRAFPGSSDILSFERAELGLTLRDPRPQD